VALHSVCRSVCTGLCHAQLQSYTWYTPRAVVWPVAVAHQRSSVQSFCFTSIGLPILRCSHEHAGECIGRGESHPPEKKETLNRHAPNVLAAQSAFFALKWKRSEEARYLLHCLDVHLLPGSCPHLAAYTMSKPELQNTCTCCYLATGKLICGAAAAKNDGHCVPGLL